MRRIELPGEERLRTGALQLNDDEPGVFVAKPLAMIAAKIVRRAIDRVKTMTDEAVEGEVVHLELLAHVLEKVNEGGEQ